MLRAAAFITNAESSMYIREDFDPIAVMLERDEPSYHTCCGGTREHDRNCPTVLWPSTAIDPLESEAE